jgi:hypothetical protein
VNSSLTRIGWLALCLILGGPCAFLALETVGLPFAAVALVLVVLIGKRRHLLAEMLLAFGASYAAVIAHFTAPWLLSSLTARDYPALALALVHELAATIVLVSGFVLLARRRPAATP